MEFLKDLFILVGRVLISGVFLWGAYDRIRNWSTSVAYMKSKNVPQVNVILPLAMVLKILGGFSVFFGWHAHLGALLLLIVTIPFTLWLHDFWKMQGNEKAVERAFFMKELAVIGALLLILAMGSGPWSIR